MSDVSPYHTLVTLLDFRNNCVFLQEEIKDGSVNLSVKSEIKAIKSFFFFNFICISQYISFKWTYIAFVIRTDLLF